MPKEHNSSFSGDHVVDEIVEHIIMEKTGVLHEHITAVKPKPEVGDGFLFNLLMYAVVGTELWLIYKEILAIFY